MKPSLLIVYDYFYPGYRAGGPIQSLTNLAAILQSRYNVSVLTSAYDLNSTEPYSNITIDAWNNVALPEYGSPVPVWYAGKRKPTLSSIKKLLQQLKSDIVYLNGIFSYRFFLLPLLVLRKSYQIKTVVCPRGMLQTGALESKQLKKKIYLTILKASGLLKEITWHATTEEEIEDIERTVGKNYRIMLASNIPAKPSSDIKFPCKENGKLKLVYLSLISEKKNLLFALEMVKKCDNVTLDIFGPVKDLKYWKKCESVMRQMPEIVKYKGEVQHSESQEIFKKYDASILLTKGENFGHSIYESMSVGRPVITSNFTPWMNLRQQKAGWNIDISSPDEGVSLLNDLCRFEPETFNEFCVGAHELATTYFSNLNSADEYRRLFS